MSLTPFYHASHKTLAFDATAAVVKSALESLNTVDAVTITLAGAAACDATPSGFLVEFTGNPGDLPPLKTTPTFAVAETVKGTREFLECSNRGTCFTKDGALAGACNCDWFYMSSDGKGERGARRDCGRYDEFMEANGYFTT